MATIRNPIEWTADQLRHTAQYVGAVSRSLGGTETGRPASLPEVRRIEIADLRNVLAAGIDDFKVFRTDVIFLCIIYPIIGLFLARYALHYDLLPLLFPLASGFALVGPAAAIGLYEMSRRREQGIKSSWASAFGTIRSPSFGAIVVLALLLVMIFLLWLAAAQVIYLLTLGPAPPSSIGTFVRDIFTTGAGWVMIGVGMSIGALFALLVLAISVVSFPLLLDQDVGLRAAMWTSVRSVLVNPGPMAVWGLIVAGALVIGSIPLFIGLVIVMPVLGHATWHLYRKVVSR